MTSRTPGLLLIAVLSACGGGSGGGSGSGTGNSGSSGASSGGPGSSGPTTGTAGSSSTSGPTTSGGITGGATGTTTSTSGEPLTTGSSSDTGSSSSSGGSSSTGGAGGACVDVSGDYGPCEAIIGYGFDGTSCRAFSGCNCAPHCDDFGPDPLSCAQDCAAAGECNAAALHPAGINKDPVVEGSFCDELDGCAGDPEAVAWLTKIFGKLDCEAAAFPCGQGQNCHLFFQGTLDAAQWSQVCAASLLPGADLQCVIFGP